MRSSIYINDWVIISSVPLLMDRSVAWGAPPIYAGTQWSSRASVSVVQTLLAWVCIFRLDLTYDQLGLDKDAASLLFFASHTI
ncbi:hypothetical protein SeLEV6574_g04756 [Synchytrium endobioticum]|uniref:Uncharacterized protein n=1 Tax=Synchytrium endobioticum TaxID=286115 RepID=A0A507CYN8_9FUNG|nr:hypothetical protein SeLEV6574_g04756 [Synchytrium endobioticum]